MRIALVSMHTSPTEVAGSGDAGGMNVVIAEAAAALAARNHDVVVVTRASQSVPAGERPLGEMHGEQPQRCPQLVALEAGAPVLAKAELPRVVSAFADGLRRLGPFDAVHAHYWLSGLAARRAYGAQGPRLAMTFHTLAAHKNALLAPGARPEPEERVAAERELTSASFVVAGSRSELGGVTEFSGTPGLGSAVVHPGVDTALFRPEPRRPEGDAPLRITVLGRVQPLKGQDLAIRAAAALAITDPRLFARTEWLVAGEPTPDAIAYAAGLRTLAVELGVSERVRFLPAQSRASAAALLASSAVVLVPSHSETFGLTALEAAACGVPVIAAGHTGLLEAVPAGAGGIHMVGRDPHAWALEIADLLRDPQRRASLGAAGRQHARAHDWRAHAAALEGIYEQLAK